VKTLRRLVAALSIVCLGAACGAPDSPNVHGVDATVSAAAVTITPSAKPSVSASASASAGEPPSFRATAWSDPEAAIELAKDSKWDPGGCIAKVEKLAKLGAGVELPPECQDDYVRACASIPGQVCVPDDCSQSDYQCYPECNTTCQDCASKCVGSCDGCKAKCTDDACKQACGKSCAACRQGCVSALDTCTSAHCSQVFDECVKSRDTEFTNSKCGAVCDKVQACVEKCPPNPAEGFNVYYTKCAEACFKRLGTGCPSRFDQICMGNPDASVNFWISRRQLHPEEAD
jgi:hypothetical protein